MYDQDNGVCSPRKKESMIWQRIAMTTSLIDFSKGLKVRGIERTMMMCKDGPKRLLIGSC